jgi:hypothetical protein
LACGGDGGDDDGDDDDAGRRNGGANTVPAPAPQQLLLQSQRWFSVARLTRLLSALVVELGPPGATLLLQLGAPQMLLTAVVPLCSPTLAASLAAVAVPRPLCGWPQGATGEALRQEQRRQQHARPAPVDTACQDVSTFITRLLRLIAGSAVVTTDLTDDSVAATATASAAAPVTPSLSSRSTAAAAAAAAVAAATLVAAGAFDLLVPAMVLPLSQNRSPCCSSAVAAAAATLELLRAGGVALAPLPETLERHHTPAPTLKEDENDDQGEDQQQQQGQQHGQQSEVTTAAVAAADETAANDAALAAVSAAAASADAPPVLAAFARAGGLDALNLLRRLSAVERQAGWGGEWLEEGRLLYERLVAPYRARR